MTTRRVLLGAALVALVLATASGWLFGPVTTPLEAAPDGMVGDGTVGDAPPRVPVRLLAARPNDPSVALIDLERGTVTRYGRMAGLPDDALGGASITPAGDFLVWAGHLARLFSGDPPTAAGRLRPQSPWRLPGIAPALNVVPSVDGEAVWLVQPGYDRHSDRYPTVAELVRLNGGALAGPFELDPGVRAVAATGDGLVLVSERPLDRERSGGPGKAWVLHLSADGSLDQVARGEPVAATADRLVRFDCPLGPGPCAVLVGGPDGSGERLVPAPPDTYWVTVGGPGVPGSSLALPTVSRDGGRMILAAVDGTRRGREVTRSTLYVVDLVTGATRAVVDAAGPPPLATLSADGRWAVLVERHDVVLLDLSGAHGPHRLEGVIPADHFVVAAG